MSWIDPAVLRGRLEQWRPIDEFDVNFRDQLLAWMDQGGFPSKKQIVCLLRRLPYVCVECGRPASYRVALDGYCFAHREVAAERRRVNPVRLQMEREFDAAQTEQRRKRVDALRAMHVRHQSANLRRRKGRAS